MGGGGGRGERERAGAEGEVGEVLPCQQCACPSSMAQPCAVCVGM